LDTHLLGAQDASIRRLGLSIFADRPVPFAPLAAELLRGQEMIEQLAQSAFAEPIDEWNRRWIIVTLVTEMLAHRRLISLFDMCIVVAFVSTRPCEAERSGPRLRVAHQMVVDKLSSIV